MSEPCLCLAVAGRGHQRQKRLRTAVTGTALNSNLDLWSLGDSLSLGQPWVYTTTRTRPARLPRALSWPGYLQEFHDGRYGRRYFRGCRRWAFSHHGD